MAKQKKQFGTWSSPVDAKLLASGLRLNDVQFDTSSNQIVWSESRGKRGVLMTQAGIDAPYELNTLSARGAVGYGGGEMTVHDGHVYFSIGNRLYKQALNDSKPIPLTPAFGGIASPQVSADGKYVAFVHTYDHADGIAVVDTDGKQMVTQISLWHRLRDATHMAP